MLNYRAKRDRLYRAVGRDIFPRSRAISRARRVVFIRLDGTEGF